MSTSSILLFDQVNQIEEENLKIRPYCTAHHFWLPVYWTLMLLKGRKKCRWPSPPTLNIAWLANCRWCKMCPLVNNCCGFSINSFDGLPPTFYNKLGYYPKCGHFGKIVSDNNCFGRNSWRSLVDLVIWPCYNKYFLYRGLDTWTFTLLSWFTSYGDVK